MINHASSRLHAGRGTDLVKSASTAPDQDYGTFQSIERNCFDVPCQGMTLGAVKDLAGIEVVQVVAPGLRQPLQCLVGCVDGTRTAVGPHLSLHPQPALVSFSAQILPQAFLWSPGLSVNRPRLVGAV